MTIDKELLYDYGITGLKAFLDTGFNQPTSLHKIIHPKKELLFYVVLIVLIAGGSNNAAVRTELILQQQQLFYKTNIHDALIPCGQILAGK